MKKIFAYLILVVVGGLLLYPAAKCLYNNSIPSENDFFGHLFLLFSATAWILLLLATIFWAIDKIIK